MKNILKILITALVAVITIALLPFYINLLTSNQEVINYANSLGFIKLTAIVGSMVVLAIILTVWLSRKQDNEASEAKDTFTKSTEADLIKFYDSLKERYQKRYDGKLDGRFEIPLEVSEDWQSDKPKTYKFDAEAKISDAVEAVRKAFREKGRLLIVGSPGSGKTVLLLKLALELLGDEYKANQKLPVIFNLASWSDDYKTFEDWLIDVLNSGNGLSKDFAKTVLRENRIIFLLDGLDELARNEESETAHKTRARCLESLNDYLREGRQTVICCRREEFAEMQKTTDADAPVSAKVEVLDLTKAQILLALLNAQQHNASRVSAEHLEKIIETNEVFLEVLSTPFYFTTALEVFDKQTLKENDFPIDVEELKKYLLDRFVESKISNTRNLIEFENDTTKIKKWLKWLAQLMERKQLITFELIDLQPNDLTRKILLRILIFTVVFTCIFLLNKWWFSTFAGLIFGTIAAFAGVFYNDSIETEEIIRWNFRELLKPLTWFLILLSGAIVSFLLGLLYLGVGINWQYGVFVGFLLGNWLVIEVFIKKSVSFTTLQYPYGRIFSSTIKSVIEIGLLFSVSFLSYSMVMVRAFDQPALLLYAFQIILGFVIGAGTRFFYSPMFGHICLRFCLYFEGSMPLKYATFLDYAAEARILEKDGGQWRFRHQNLQEYFAGLDEDLTTK